MKHKLDDVSYTKRQRVELFFSYAYCIMSVVLMIFILVTDLPFLTMIVGCTTLLTIGIMSLLYVLSRRNRTDHKQLHDMLVNLGANNKNDAEPADEL